MSVEIRLRWADSRNLECDWGVIEYSRLCPECGEVGPLMLTAEDYVFKLACEGPDDSMEPYTNSVTVHGNRVFAHIDRRGQRWTGELHDAHRWDRDEHSATSSLATRLLMGRWPD